MASFEFVRLGIPCTVQTRNPSRLDNYRRDVRRAARALWPGEVAPLTVVVKVSISYYYTSDEIDIDNIIKPILDQLNGLVYVDDKQVVRVVGQKQNILAAEQSALLLPLIRTQLLADGLRSKDNFVYVLVEWN